MSSLTESQRERAAHIQEALGGRIMDTVSGARRSGIPDAYQEQLLGAMATSLLMYAQKYPDWAARVIAGSQPEGVDAGALERVWEDLEL